MIALYVTYDYYITGTRNCNYISFAKIYILIIDINTELKGSRYKDRISKKGHFKNGIIGISINLKKPGSKAQALVD